MSKRREKRQQLAVPVRLRAGAKGHESPPLNGVTLDVSTRGARLQILATLKAGDIVWIERGRAKAPFRVCWVGVRGSEKQGQIGVECVTEDFTWGEPLARIPDDPYHDPNDPKNFPMLIPVDEVTAAALAPVSTPQKKLEPVTESPAPKRVIASGEVEVRTESGRRITLKSRLRDVSARGCFVLTSAPLTSQIKVLLSMNLDGEHHIESRGIVRTSDLSSGMWIDFTEMENDSRVRLQHYLEKRKHTAAHS